MGRRSPIDEERDDPVGKIRQRNVPGEKDPLRGSPASGGHGPELDALAQGLTGQSLQVGSPGRPRHQRWRREIIDPKPARTRWFRLFWIRANDLEVGGPSQRDQGIARAGSRMWSPGRRLDAQQSLHVLHADRQVGCRIHQVVNLGQKAGTPCRL